MSNSAVITDVLERAKSWPEDDLATLTEFAREIEAHRSGVHVMTPDERAAVDRGMAQAERGEFATDAEMLALRARFGGT